MKKRKRMEEEKPADHKSSSLYSYVIAPTFHSRHSALYFYFATFPSIIPDYRVTTQLTCAASSDSSYEASLVQHTKKTKLSSARQRNSIYE